MRVLHVLASLEAGGVEKWLSDITLENSRRNNPLSIDVVITSSERSGGDFFEDAVKAAGARVIRLPNSNRFIYFYSLFKLLRDERYDVVHSHLYYFSGVVLLLAAALGVRCRIAHCHNNVSIPKGKIRRAYEGVMRFLIKKFATERLAVSLESGSLFFSGNKECLVFPCGIDYYVAQSMDCREVIDNKDLLKAFLSSNNGSEDVVNVVHVGSFSHQKNHEFIREIVRVSANRASSKRYRFWLIGQGPLFGSEKEKFNSLGGDVIFLGNIVPVKEFLFNVADVFIFPSRYEGLGLAVIEAQSQGVYSLVSEFVPVEAQVSSYYKVMSVSHKQDALNWFLEIDSLNLSSLRKNKAAMAEEVVGVLRKSDMHISKNFDKLESVYGFSNN